MFVRAAALASRVSATPGSMGHNASCRKEYARSLEYGKLSFVVGTIAQRRSPPAITFFSPIKMESEKRNRWNSEQSAVGASCPSISIRHDFLSRCTFYLIQKFSLLSLNKGIAADSKSISQVRAWGACHALLSPRQCHFISKLFSRCLILFYYYMHSSQIRIIASGWLGWGSFVWK